MIVQSASADGTHFVIAMQQHTTFAGQLAAHFGNGQFAAIEPTEPMQFIVDNHDAGWIALDAEAPQSPDTGLPFNLTATPLPQIISTSAGSPALNEAHHAFSGIISSMHTYGLYTGRYGLSDKVFLDAIPADLRPSVDEMLAAEGERQQRLKGALASSDPDHGSNDFLFHAYKQLQFFDTLSLYFHMAPEGERGSAEFLNVPRAVGDDVSIEVTELGEGRYDVMPFPFDVNELKVSTEGRYLAPQTQGTSLPEVLAATPVSEQVVTLTGAS